MVEWKIVFTQQALKDAKKITAAGLREKVEQLLDMVGVDPFTTPPSFEKLIGDLSGSFSRRLSIQHRCIYQVLRKEKVVKVIRMWTHYE